MRRRRARRTFPGLEVAGTVVAGRSRRRSLAGRRRVCALLAGGGYAEYCCRAGTAVPAGAATAWSSRSAAAIPETFFTVWTNVFERGRLQAGESLLVHGGSSGIGTTAIQLARALGARVFATAGSAEKCAACERLGAERAINYREADFVAAIARADRRPRRRRDSRHGRRRLPAAEPRRCSRVDGRLVQIALLGGAKAADQPGAR